MPVQASTAAPPLLQHIHCCCCFAAPLPIHRCGSYLAAAPPLGLLELSKLRSPDKYSSRTPPSSNRLHPRPHPLHLTIHYLDATRGTTEHFPVEDLSFPRRHCPTPGAPPLAKFRRLRPPKPKRRHPKLPHHLSSGVVAGEGRPARSYTATGAREAHGKVALKRAPRTLTAKWCLQRRPAPVSSPLPLLLVLSSAGAGT